MKEGRLALKIKQYVSIVSLIPTVELFAFENSIWHFEDWVCMFGLLHSAITGT
jgi:hypothetical protein